MLALELALASLSVLSLSSLYLPPLSRLRPLLLSLLHLISCPLLLSAAFCCQEAGSRGVSFYSRSHRSCHFLVLIFDHALLRSLSHLLSLPSLLLILHVLSLLLSLWAHSSHPRILTLTCCSTYALAFAFVLDLPLFLVLLLYLLLSISVVCAITSSRTTLGVLDIYNSMSFLLVAGARLLGGKVAVGCRFRLFLLLVSFRSVHLFCVCPIAFLFSMLCLHPHLPFFHSFRSER